MSSTALSRGAARLRPFAAPIGAAFGALALVFSSPAGAQELNLYTYREPALIKPLIDAFTKESGVKVNTLFAASGLEERLQAEGANSPADVLLTVDIGRLQQAKDYGVTQRVRSDALEKAIPAAYRDPEGHWHGVSLRGRVVYAAENRIKADAITYEELADPRWKGKICTRSGQHLYNISLIAAVVAHIGEAKAEEWLKGVKANLAKRPSGGDRDAVKDVAVGVCDIGLGNTYYVALMLNGTDAEQRKQAEAVKVILPTFKDGGTHVNISGVALMKHTPNRDSAVKFIEFLASDTGQKLHAQLNYEYPVKPGIALDETVASFGKLNPDNVPIAEIARHRKTAAALVEKVGFDR
jgi:iron(III) transport system substrate-binding protein